MSHCPDNTEWTLYAADELSAARRRALAAHLDVCEVCRREAAAQSRGLKALGRLDREPAVRPEAMETLRQRLRFAAAHKPARPTILTLGRRYGWVAAAALILVVAGVWAIRPPAPAVNQPRLISDTQIIEELAEISASVELLEASLNGKAPEPPTVRPNICDEDAADEIEQFMEYLRTEMDA